MKSRIGRHVARKWEEKLGYDFGGKARRKKTIRKTTT
jgi:hypothetical protein